jgi:hypothetical protein
MLLAAQAAWGHEFWMQPQRFGLQAGEDAVLSLYVGENFAGGQVALTRPLFIRLAQQVNGEAIDLRAQVPQDGDSGEMVLPVAGAGTQLLWADTQPAHLELEAGRFFAYLHDEGLDFINTAREAKGQLALPGRERFRRHIKTLLRREGAATEADARTAMQRTAQTIEIVPLSDPYASAPGRDLGFQVLFEGKPLANALVKFWHRRGGQTLVVRTTTNAQGRVVFAPPWPGVWMASVVHMTAASDAKACDCDWESYWGNLTFEISAR